MQNSHGIEFKTCCASCRFKDLTRLMTSRFCIKHHKSVKPAEWCEQWALSEQLDTANTSKMVRNWKSRKYVTQISDISFQKLRRVRLRSAI